MSFLKANAELKQTVQKLWPEYLGDAFFVPVLSLSYGDVVSDCPQRIGKFLRCSPAQVAAEIIANLPTNFSGQCSFENDFLNAFLVPLAESWDERERSFSVVTETLPTKISVVLPSFSRYASKDEFFRLSALAALHFVSARICGVATDITFGAKKVLNFEDEISLKKIYSEIFWQIKQMQELSGVELKEELYSVLEDRKEVKTHLWLAPSSIKKREFNQLYHEKVATCDNVQLSCPQRGWLSGCDDLSDLKNLEEWSEKDLMALCFYLAGEKQGVDLQLCTAKFAESDNLLWLLSSLAIRFKRLSLKKSASVVPDYRKVPEKLGFLMRRGFFLPFFLKDAALNGNVREYVLVLSQFLYGVLEVAGDPLLRIALDQGKISDEIGEILTGVDSILSDTIKTWGTWLGES